MKHFSRYILTDILGRTIATQTVQDGFTLVAELLERRLQPTASAVNGVDVEAFRAPQGGYRFWGKGRVLLAVNDILRIELTVPYPDLFTTAVAHLLTGVPLDEKTIGIFLPEEKEETPDEERDRGTPWRALAEESGAQNLPALLPAHPEEIDPIALVACAAALPKSSWGDDLREEIHRLFRVALERPPLEALELFAHGYLYPATHAFTLALVFDCISPRPILPRRRTEILLTLVQENLELFSEVPLLLRWSGSEWIADLLHLNIVNTSIPPLVFSFLSINF
ncbi:hypothetical protein [Thermosulfurimonas sp. F29]|uniref:hypothetical protein n=1 Tax=Thermosulfurimonas sp. F29 TaxID=2867247 RepID=UPI001C8409E0|nr:hypothetical protein [Thermosulfurimonas sp. F29]MBX6424102.1 hypothetical protein [Thermosulfurimonas sp. F29]